MPYFVSSGNFFLSPALPSGDRDTGNEIIIDPNPTYPDYGVRIDMSLQPSKGRMVVQRAPNNIEEKRWVWKDYGPQVPGYSGWYWNLFQYQEHIRVSGGNSPYVYLKENVTGEFGLYNSGTGKIVPDWIRCRIIEVARDVRQDGGYVRFDETVLRFVIDDPNFKVV